LKIPFPRLPQFLISATNILNNNDPQDRVLEELAIKSVKRVDEHAVTMAELEAGHEERMDELNRTWEQRIRQADGELQRLRKKLKMHQRAGQDLVEENEREEKMYQEKVRVPPEDLLAC
jgi:hypothetical protein